MLSPKLVPLYMLLKSKKIFYFHATYDYSFSKPTLYDVVMEKVSEFLMYKSDLVLATQHPLAWQLRLRLGIDAKVLHHPTYHPIKKSFFDEEKSISLPFKDYFLYFGGIDRVSKGTDVLIEAVNGSDIPVVLAGRGKKDYSNSKNILHINRWVSDAELFYLVKNSKAVVLPYLVSSQFSGCLAVAYRFGKPVIAPFCNSFQNYIKPARTGLFFEQGNSMDLKEKLEEFDHYKFDSKYIHELDSSLSSRTLAELSKILAEF
jgi:glycosyltransferase involved in cell wall biosynthesis